MKQYIDELFQVHKDTTFDQFLLNELNFHLLQVENGWIALAESKDVDWEEEYRFLLKDLGRSLNRAIAFIERTQGPDIISILYTEILNLVESKFAPKAYVTENEAVQIQFTLTTLGASFNPEILELGLIKEGEMLDYLNESFLSALESFEKKQTPEG